jgi:hypothetical protein
MKAEDVKMPFNQPNYAKGFVYALAAVVVGVVAWVILWRFGFIASIVAFGLSAGAVWLYQKGAGADVDKKGAGIVIGLVLAGLVLAFLAGMMSDAWDVYTSADIKGTGSLFSAEFWSFFTGNLGSSELWNAYLPDIGMAVLFGALGCFGVIKDLIDKQKQPKKV